MEEEKTHEEFKKNTEIIMEKDLKKLLRSRSGHTKTEHLALKELVAAETLMGEFVRLIWVSAFYHGVDRTVRAYKNDYKKWRNNDRRKEKTD